MFNNILSILSFLTIIPLRRTKYGLDYISKNMYLFPIVGLIIGFLVGMISHLLFEKVNDLILGFMVIITIIIITGIHHTDALADLADGLMIRGTKEQKHKVMMDPRNGTAGTVILIIYVIGSIIFISSIEDDTKLMSMVIVAEILSKYSMILQCHLGVSAWEGMNTAFIRNMKSKKKFAVSTIIVAILVLVFGFDLYYTILALLAMLLTSILILYISNRSFGGISGDVMGATNELSRFFVYLTYALF